jgi:hypothetical protein
VVPEDGGNILLRKVGTLELEALCFSEMGDTHLLDHKSEDNGIYKLIQIQTVFLKVATNFADYTLSLGNVSTPDRKVGDFKITN